MRKRIGAILLSIILLGVVVALVRTEYNLVNLNNQLKNQSIDIGNLKTNLEKIDNNFIKLCGRVKDSELEIGSIGEELTKLSKRVSFLETKVLPPGEPKKREFPASGIKGGLDISVERYQGKERYDLNMSRLNSYKPLPFATNWQALNGLWLKLNGLEIGEDNEEIIAGQGDGTDNNANALIFPDSNTKYTFSAGFKLLDRDITDDYTRFHTNYLGLYLRYQDEYNFIRIDTLEAYRPAGYQFIRLLIRENGNFVSVKNIPVKGFYPETLFAAWHTLKVDDDGSEVVVLLDNQEILRADYSSTVPIGKKGFLANIATRILFKNMQVLPK